MHPCGCFLARNILELKLTCFPGLGCMKRVMSFHAPAAGLYLFPFISGCTQLLSHFFFKSDAHPDPDTRRMQVCKFQLCSVYGIADRVNHREVAFLLPSGKLCCFRPLVRFSQIHHLPVSFIFLCQVITVGCRQRPLQAGSHIDHIFIRPDRSASFESEQAKKQGRKEFSVSGTHLFVLAIILLQPQIQGFFPVVILVGLQHTPCQCIKSAHVISPPCSCESSVHH